MHETSDFFYSIITFSYTKYLVHLYTVDVVFTLSYNITLRVNITSKYEVLPPLYDVNYHWHVMPSVNVT